MQNLKTSEKSLEVILQKIFDRFYETYLSNRPEENFIILNKTEYMDLSILIDSGTCSESSLQSAYRLLKETIRRFIQNAYLPVFNLGFSVEINTKNYLQLIELYVTAIKNFDKAKQYIKKFYRHLDSKSVQKMYLLDRTSWDHFDVAFKEILIAKYKVHLIKLIFIWFLENHASEINEQSMQNFRVFLKSFVELANNSLFHIEKLKKEIETEIKKVFENKARVFYQSCSKFPTTEYLQATAHFKSRVRQNIDTIVEDIPLLNSLQVDIHSEVNKCLLDNIILRLVNNDFLEISLILENKDVESLRNIYILFLDSEEKIEKFKDFFTKFITQKSLKIMSIQLPEQKEVDALVAFLIEIDDIIATHFINNKNLRYSTNKAIEIFMGELSSNKSQIQNDFFLIRIFDYLKSKIDRQESVSQSIKKLSDIITYTSAKAFNKYVTTYLTKKVLNYYYRRNDFGPELEIMSVFKTKMGDESCAQLISILKDLSEYSIKNLSKFEAFKKNLNLPILESRSLNLLLVSKYDHTPPFNANATKEFRFFTDIIESFYSVHIKNENQQLEFDFTFGYCETEVDFGQIKFTICGNPLYSLILITISDKGPINFQQLVNYLINQSSIKVVEYQRDVLFYINQLLENNLICKNDNMYSFNRGFQPVFDSFINLKYIENRQEDTPSDCIEKIDRNYEMESKIMRMVKTRSHSVEELRTYLQTDIFNFDLNWFRLSLQYLIQNDLLITCGLNKESVKFN